MKNKNNSKIFISIAIVLVLLGTSLLLSKIVGASNDNEIMIKSAKIKAIKTGSENYDAFDADNNSNIGETETSNYIAGNDSSESNRIVRSFDTITYDFEYLIADKNSDTPHTDKTVEINVELTEEEAKYVTFDMNAIPGERNKTFSFSGIETTRPFENSITLYVLGAPNGTTINPKFNIKESTDQDGGVNLGKVSSTVNYYSVDNNTYSETAEFQNIMPTVVSSKTATIKVEGLTTPGQIGVYDGKSGRYVTYVAGLYIEGDTDKGIKGLDMPTGNITFNSNFNSDSTENIVLKNEWARLFDNNKVGDVDAIFVFEPYSTTDTNKNEKQTKGPGNLNVQITGNSYAATVSDYNVAYNFPTLNSNDYPIENKYYIGTYAFTVFSPRVKADGKNPIYVEYSIDSVNMTGTNNETYSVGSFNGSTVNEYFASNESIYESDFYINDNKLSSNDSIGSLSKGTEVIYKTEFDYKKTTDSEGLKEIIKVNPNAFRVMNYDENSEVNIKLTCGELECTNISKDDFEVKYLTGEFKNTYYYVSEVDQRLKNEDKDAFNNICTNTNISNLSNDQVLNIYGSPCISANPGAEITYDKINDAVDEDENEIPITKVIVQTKPGIKLPDNINVQVELKLRVRNVADITRPYQVATTLSTSDYDNVLKYYYPEGTEVINPDNYVLPTISGKDVIGVNNVSYAKSIRIANYTSDQEIKVLNKDSDDKMKTTYNTKDNDTIVYRVKPIITDNNMNVGADDTWIVKYVKLEIVLPSELSYVADRQLDKFLDNVTVTNSGTVLEYTLPYTKPNADNSYIEFKSILSSKIKDTGIPVTVRSYISALNVNKEVDNSLFGKSYKDFTIYANGESKVILEQRLGSNGSITEKDGEFSYLLSVYNNTSDDVTNYTIMDILPYTNDSRNSKISGTYEVKLNVPDSLNGATIYCSTDDSSSIKRDINDSSNTWTECSDITSTYKDITAFKITDISVDIDNYTDPVEVIIKPTNNNYSDTYTNDFIGGSDNNKTTTSNKISVKVVSRTISGKVFNDINENGIQDSSDTYVANVPVSLYRIENEEETKVAETTTNNDGKYEFKDLDTGRYYINLGYDGSKYDLTLRYANVDERIDSDAYKISDTIARISNKKVPNDPFGILVTREDISLENYDMGLIPRYSFGFDIKKYITKIDLSYNGNLTTKNYNNQSKVVIDVRRSSLSTLKIYYGIAITNNSSKSGYVTEIEENIPDGLIFDQSEPENKDWVLVNGKAYSTSLSSELIRPGETKYLQIVLFMPSRETAATFINTVSILDMAEYDPAIANDKEYVNDNDYQVGESVNYAGMSWHVIDTTYVDDGSQMVTLLADSGSIPQKMGHTNSGSDLYKWGQSNINYYLNNEYMLSLDYGVLYDIPVCNDASGLEIASYGGSVSGVCQSNDFVNSRVRLLSSEEYTRLKTSSLSNIDWLTGNEDYWLGSSDDTRPLYSMIGNDSYGNISTSTYNKAYYVSSTGIKSDTASSLKEVRLVITISSRNILFD